MKNYLTFDWEEWSDTASMEGWNSSATSVKILQSATERILEMIRPLSATFFVLATRVKEHVALIRRISKDGHEIALHGLEHVPMSRYSPVRFREDILTAKNIVEDITGVPVIGFRAPNFSMTVQHRWALDILFSCGFKYDSSMSLRVFRDYSRRGCLPIREVPRSGVGPGMLPLPFGGGVFLRIYPYAWTRSWIRQANACGERSMVYVHPWELDASWMKVHRLPWRARALMGSGVAAAKERLSRLLKDFLFGSIRDILDDEKVNDR